MKKTVFIPILAVFVFASCNRTEKKVSANENIQNDTEDIIWSKSFVKDLEFELKNPCLEEEDEPLNVFVPLKVCQVEHQWFDTDDRSTLVHHLLKAWETKRIVGYSDPNLKKAFLFAEAKMMKDTFYSMPSKENKSTTFFQEYLSNPQEITGFKVRQTINYDKNKGRFVWSANTIGLVRNNDKVLVWFPVAPMPQVADMNTPDIAWAYSARLNNIPLEADSTEQTTGILLVAKNNFINHFVKTPDLEYYDGMPLVKIPQTERAKLVSMVDTIITFDPKTFEETVEISVTPLEPSTLNALTFKTTWAFDSKHGTLMSRMDFFRPQIMRYNQKSEFIFKRALATCR